MLDLPVFPGKLVIWLLLMLSIVSWVMILTKILFLARSRKVDKQFTDRLRQSRTTLEVFEEGWECDHSPKHKIYMSGAREAAYQLLGAHNPQGDMRHRIQKAGKLSSRQLDFLRAAFDAGLRSACSQLYRGVEGLRIISAFALFLGALGLAWTLMTGFDSATEFSEIAPKVGAALGFAVVAIFVSMPATLARIAFCVAVEKRKLQLQRFSEDIARLFERSLGASSEPATTDSASPSAGDREAEEAGDDMDEDEPGSSPRKKQYHSIRERLLRTESEPPHEMEMNPIARAALR